MARYYATGKGRFAKTHIMTGYGDEFVTNCGLKFRRNTNPFKDLTIVKVKPAGRTLEGSIWDFPEATCDNCLNNPLKPWSHFPSDGKRKDESGSEGLRRGQRGGMDVDLQQRGHGGDQHDSCRVDPTSRGTEQRHGGGLDDRRRGGGD